jgi:hypothetical protein
VKLRSRTCRHGAWDSLAGPNPTMDQRVYCTALHPSVGRCGIIICVGLVVIYAATGEASGAAVVLFVGSTRDASRVCSR